MYVTRANSPTQITLVTNSPTRTDNCASGESVLEKPPRRPIGAESRLRYIEKLLSGQEMYTQQQKQVKL